MVSSLMVASPAWATLIPQPTTTFSSTAGVGLSLVNFQITVTNVSDGVGDTGHLMNPVQLVGLGFTPSCARFDGDACVSPEPDVFLMKTGPEAATGISGACLDTKFSVAPADGSGRHAIVPNSTLTLGPATGQGTLPRRCTVEVTMLEVDHVPLTDVDPAAAGTQTIRQVDAEISTLDGSDSGIRSHKANVTVVRAPVTLSGVSSPNVLSGTTVAPADTTFATATLKRQNPNANPDPTGTISFKLIGPGPDLACSAPVAFASGPVTLDPASGIARSPDSPPLVEGLYNWVVSYSGDANYQGIATPVGCLYDSLRFEVEGEAPWSGAAVDNDYDGDRSTDVAVYRPSSGAWYVKDQFSTYWGTNGDVPVPGDYNGDKAADVAVYRPSSGAWYVKDQFSTYWGTNGDVPVPGDYNSDGKTDVAFYRPSTGHWYVRGGFTYHWGVEGDIAVPGDYDGDGTTDVAVYRPSNSAWYVRGQISTYFGTKGDVPVPGDYDGDGTTDVAVYRPSTGHWYVQDKSSSYWGILGDIAVPGDYDGDGTTDVAVYRPSNGAWYVKGQFNAYWGVEGDLALSVPAYRRVQPSSGS